MNTELMNTIAAANDKAQYDACAKRLIYANNEPKSVLAQDLGDCRDNE